MPDFATAAQTLRSRFKTEFHNQRSEPIEFDNAPGLVDVNGDFQEEPKDSNGDPVAWVRFNIRASNATQQTLGSVGHRQFRQPGVVIVQVFVPTGTGDGKLYDIADGVAAALRGVTISGVRLKATSPPQFVGIDGAWYQTNSRTEYEFDLTA